MRLMFIAAVCAAALWAPAAGSRAAEPDRVCEGRAGSSSEDYLTVSFWFNGDGTTDVTATWVPVVTQQGDDRVGLLLGYRGFGPHKIGKPDQILVPAVISGLDTPRAQLQAGGRTWTKAMRAFQEGWLSIMTSSSERENHDALDVIDGATTATVTILDRSGRTVGNASYDLNLQRRDELFTAAYARAMKASEDRQSCDEA